MGRVAMGAGTLAMVIGLATGSVGLAVGQAPAKKPGARRGKE